MKHIAIVTGGSSGLGKEFVKLLDRGAGGPLQEIWLIARDTSKLDEVAATLKTPVKCLALDLTDSSSFATLDAALAAQKDLNVQWLVNCAGFGKFGPFTSIGAVANGNMVKLNCLAVVELCYSCLLYMHAGSRIINIASLAALVPQPGLAVYSATKRFVMDFSYALDGELGSAGIHVSALCPKFMDTHFLDKPGNAQTLKRLEWVGFEDPAACAAKALRQSVAGKVCIITSPSVKVFHFFSKLLPTPAVMKAQSLVSDLAERLGK